MPPEWSNLEEHARAIVGDARERCQAEQAFLFDGEGEHVWPARVPATPEHLRLLNDAIDLIELLEIQRPKPFIGHDAADRFSVTALGDELDLYLVCIGFPDRDAAEQRLRRLPPEVTGGVGRLRSQLKQIASGGR